MRRTTRIGLALSSAIFVAVGALIVLALNDSKAHPDRIGNIESWSASLPVDLEKRPRVLATGLEDVRGIACDAHGNVFLAEANGRVLLYPSDMLNRDRSGLLEPEKIDVRGVAFSGSLFLSEHGRGLLVRRDIVPGPALGPENLIYAPNLTGPSGIAAAGGTLFVTDDRPWPASGQESSFDSSDYSRWLDKGNQRLFGDAVAGTPDGGGGYIWATIASRLRHPSGIAAVSPVGPVYVAESDASEVKWPIFAYQNNAWVQTGALASVPAPTGDTMPLFLGVAIAGKFVVAAAPKSLYIFDGQSRLGRIVFEDAVTGVAANGKDVYLIVGHRLCYLKLR